MIGKIVKGKSFKGCVSYVMNKLDAKLLHSEGVLNVDTKTIVNSFYMQSLLNPKLAKSVGHISLSFAKEDANKLTDSVMIKLAQEYLKAMKIENTQYIIVRHNDTSHPHCHLVFNRVDNNGRTISDKNDQYRNEKICKTLKEKYRLTFGKDKSKVNVDKLRTAEKAKHEIYHAIKTGTLMAKNWKQFEHILSLQGVEIKYKLKGQTDEVQGISFKKGEYSFKGSEVDRSFSYSKLNNQLQANDLKYTQSQIQQPRNDSSILESVASIGTLEQHGENYEDISFAHRMENEEKERQRKAKRRGIRR